MAMDKPIWWDYVEFYPDEDEEGYDGEHNGGIKCLKDGAPYKVRKEFEEFLKAEESGIKL